MRNDSLRSALRARTSTVHHQLDMATGEFDSVATYAAFVRNTHRFRAAVERTLASDLDPEWTVDAIAPLIALDLGDVHSAVPEQADFALQKWTKWSRFGAHYVLEGSSIGARLLFRRAEALGLSATFGARHLSHQASDHERWRRFVDILDTVPDDERRDEALEAAEATFLFALTVYSEATREPV